MLYEILNKIKNIRLTNNTKESIPLLESYIRTDELFSKCIQYCYDKTKKYKIKKIPKIQVRKNSRFSKLTEEEKIEKAFLYLEYFTQHLKIKDKYHNDFISLVNQIEYGIEVFSLILKRSFSIYIGSSQIMKSCIGLCEGYPKLLYSPQSNLKMLFCPVYAFDFYNYKYMRLFIEVKDNKIRYLTSNSIEIKLHNPELNKLILNHTKQYGDYVYVCQMALKVNPKTNKRKNIKQKSIPTHIKKYNIKKDFFLDKYYHSIILKRLIGNQSYHNKQKNEFPYIDIHIEYIIPYDNFYKFKYDMNMTQQLQQPIWTEFPNTDFISTMKYKSINNERQLLCYAYEQLKKNISIIAKQHNSIYKTGKTHKNMLITRVEKCVLKVIDVEYLDKKKMKPVLHCIDATNLLFNKIDSFVDVKFQYSIKNLDNVIGKYVEVIFANIFETCNKSDGYNTEKVKTRLGNCHIINFTDKLPTAYCNIISRTAIKTVKEETWNKTLKQKKMRLKPIVKFHHQKLAGIIETIQDN